MDILYKKDENRFKKGENLTNYQIFQERLLKLEEKVLKITNKHKFEDKRIYNSKKDENLKEISHETLSSLVFSTSSLNNFQQKLYFIDKCIESFVNVYEGSESISNLYRNNFLQIFNTSHYANYYKQLCKIEKKRIFLHKKNPTKTKTIIFDLDETLIHCNDSLDIKSDIYLDYKSDYGFCSKVLNLK